MIDCVVLTELHLQQCLNSELMVLEIKCMFFKGVGAWKEEQRLCCAICASHATLQVRGSLQQQLLKDGLCFWETRRRLAVANLFLAADTQTMATYVKQPTCWPKHGALCCCIPLEDGTEGVPLGVLYGKEEDKLSQLLREVSKQLPLATTRSWTDGFCSLEAVSDDHRPVYASHLTALLVTPLLRWIMQEMLWSIRHSRAEDWKESSLGVWTHFWIKSETPLDSSFSRKDKKDPKLIGGLWFSRAWVFVLRLNLQSIYLVIHTESSKWWICKSVT